MELKHAKQKIEEAVKNKELFKYFEINVLLR